MRFTLDGDRIVLRAEAREQEVLDGLITEFAALARTRSADPMRGEKAPKDPALARLLPDPVHDDAEAAADLRFMTEASILAHKLANAETVQASLPTADGSAELSATEELAWLKTLTDLRLVLAARLGIERDSDRGRTETELDRWMQTAYQWLGMAQSDLLDALDARDESAQSGEPTEPTEPAQ